MMGALKVKDQVTVEFEGSLYRPASARATPGSAVGLRREAPQAAALWEPSEAFAQRTRLRAYIDWLAAYHGVEVEDYDELWRWSVGDVEALLVVDRRVLRRPLPRAPEQVLERARCRARGGSRAPRSPIPSTSSAAATTTRWRSAMPPSCARWRR